MRKIIKIDEEKCDGCGLCATACAEGAIQIIAGKARLVSDNYCDGLGACLGECPQGALTMEEREAAGFDPAAVERHLAAAGNAHHGHGKTADTMACGCPSSMTQILTPVAPSADQTTGADSQLGQWPVQLRLVPVNAPFFDGKPLVISADCVPFAYAGFHRDLLSGKALVVGCPKLDDTELYRNKLTEIFLAHDIPQVEILFMEVPCCSALLRLVQGALADSGKTIPLLAIKVGIRGNIVESRQL
ncbi:MAG TPA: 4Fe-4S binding protein [Patescibacteria group bacterium]|nr:4Fe-4S binding protein [Patescibacteria group bacterium]